MKKQILIRGLIGFPMGLAIGYVITILISLALAEGYYSPCAPAFTEQLGSEMGAVVLQAVLFGLLGSAFAAASTIWEMEHWSIAKQTGLYFLITAFVMLPIAYVANWMEHNLLGFLQHFGIFFAVFLLNWGIQYFVLKRKIKKMNEKLQ